MNSISSTQCLSCQRTGGTLISLVGLNILIKGKFSANVHGKNRYVYMTTGAIAILGGIYYGWIDTYFEEVSRYNQLAIKFLTKFEIIEIQRMASNLKRRLSSLL